MRILPLFALLLGSTLLAAEPPTVETRELPRFPAVESGDALATFQIKPGFHLELVAAEPLVTSPVAISFDENGRMFVCEMRDYSEQRDEKPHLGRVRLLEDRDGDGKCEQATVFADDLPWPTAVMWANGGVFVCASPDIWWLKDTDGDGRADVREVVFTGFNTGNPKLNVQALPNSLCWGPDNRIHLQTGGGNRGLIRCLKRPELAPQELASRDFWFDPRTFDFGFEAGGGQYGMSYDDAGRRFVCNNSDHLRTYLFDSRYAARNPFCPLPSALVSVAADGPAAEVFRISPDEPWRVVRTRWRVAGKVPGVVEGGGRVSGYFTGATGTTVYRGDAYGPEFVGNTFTGDAGGNLVHRKIIRANGVSVVGERPADERKVEFLASRDTWFRPVNFANAPDGTLYVIDMYREVIEHPWSIPESIKQHLDLTSGRDSGRIWRIAPDGFKPNPAPKLGSATTEQLVILLGHPNGWLRDTATRLLCERRDPAAIPLLEKAVAEKVAPLRRLHALRALDGLGAVSETVLFPALLNTENSSDALRELAIRLCESHLHDGHASEVMWERLRSLSGDPSPRVRLQLAFTLGEVTNDGVIEMLASLISWRGVTDFPAVAAAAVFSGPPDRMAPLIQVMLAKRGFDDLFEVEQTFGPFVKGVAGRNSPDELAALFAQATSPHPRFWMLNALGEGLRGTGKSLASLDPESKRLPGVFAAARRVLADRNEDYFQRHYAALLLSFDKTEISHKALLDALTETLGGGAFGPREAVLESLDRAGWNEAVTMILKYWGVSSDRRDEYFRFLIAKPARTVALLEAVAAGKIDAKELLPDQAAQLRTSRDPKIAALAAKLLPAPFVENRKAIINLFSPALQSAGDSTKGHAIYQQRCAICHRFRGEGNAFGPDLESMVTGGKEKLLTHILDPSRELAPQFAAYTIELTDGTSLAGVLASETPEAVTLREPMGRESTIARSRIARAQTTGKSPMPEGLEAGLTVEDFGNLLEFLTTVPKQ